MICPECGGKIIDNICSECGYQIKKEYNVDNQGTKKKINKFFLIIVICFVFVIGLRIILSRVESNNNENNNNNLVASYCVGGKYIEDVSITDVIDNYSCEVFASYMIDSYGNELRDNHYKYLVSLAKIEVYEIVKNFTGSQISNLYSEYIYDPVYYEYLIDNDEFDVIDEKYYNEIMDYAYEEGNLLLWKVLLKGNSNIDNDYEWNHLYYYFGPNSYSSKVADYILDEMKKTLVEKRDFVVSYYEYNPKDLRLISFFDEKLFKEALNSGNLNKNMVYNFAKYVEFMSLKDLENYVTWGGYFHQKDTAIFDNFFEYYIFNAGSNVEDTQYKEKVRYILNVAKSNGYDIIYEGDLDTYINGHYLTMVSGSRQYIKEVYKIMKNAGFKCYRECSFEKFYK